MDSLAASQRRITACQFWRNSVRFDGILADIVYQNSVFLWPYGRSSVFSAALWAAPLLERPGVPLKVIARPLTAKEISFPIINPKAGIFLIRQLFAIFGSVVGSWQVSVPFCIYAVNSEILKDRFGIYKYCWKM